MKQPKLKAYLITASYHKHTSDYTEGNGAIRSFAIIARYEEEAINKFKYHIIYNLGYEEENLKIIAVQLLRKSKKNAKWYTQEYYTMQEDLIKNYKERKIK